MKVLNRNQTIKRLKIDRKFHGTKLIYMPVRAIYRKFAFQNKKFKEHFDNLLNSRFPIK